MTDRLHSCRSSWVRRVALAPILFCSFACATADLRPPGGDFEAGAEAEGRRWLERAAAAQGGDALRAHPTISLWMSDEWPGWFMQSLGMPWPEDGQRFRIDARVLTDDGRLTFLGGDEDGAGWGIQRWVTYRFDADGRLHFDPPNDPDERVKFWIPTTLYFPFMAWRLQEASVIRWIGPEEIGGRTYQRVFVSWGRADPQDDVDQYVVFIDEQTHLLRWARYTVRDVAGFAVGLMRYEDYRSFGPLKLPTSLRVVADYEAEETGLHRYRLEKAELSPTLPAGWLYPRPELSADK